MKIDGQFGEELFQKLNHINFQNSETRKRLNSSNLYPRSGQQHRIRDRNRDFSVVGIIRQPLSFIVCSNYVTNLLKFKSLICDLTIIKSKLQ